MPRNRNRPQRPFGAGVITSNGTGVRIRASAPQLVEKYEDLARDATFTGDKMLAELHSQHAEHYRRVMAAAPPVVP